MELFFPLVSYIEKHPDSLVFIRQDAKKLYYATVVTLNRHLNDGRIEWCTDFGKRKNPYKKLIPIWDSNSGLTIAEGSANASEGALNLDVKVQRNSETTKKNQEKVAKTLKMMRFCLCQIAKPSTH